MENPNKTLFDCQQMFRHACAFSDCADFAGEKLRRGSTDIEWYSTPTIVNAAFACEVYLKALIKYHGIPIKKKHKLKDLFELLPDNLKEWIKVIVMNNYGGMWTDAFGREYLECISNAFEEWRYVYEYSNLQIDLGFLALFRNVLREACSQLFFGITWDDFL